METTAGKWRRFHSIKPVYRRWPEGQAIFLSRLWMGAESSPADWSSIMARMSSRVASECARRKV